MAINNLEINKIKCAFLLNTIIAAEPILDEQRITVDIDSLTINDKYKQYIKRFIKITSRDFNFRNPNEKLATLKISKHSNSYYLAKKNKIKLYNKNDIYHELFHVFTSYKKSENHKFNGFNQSGIFYDIGNSLDEGYTDLLSNRYFNSEISYMIETNISNKVELMLGKDKMRSMYCSNNLHDLIKFLIKHSTKREAIGFITMMDKLDKYNYDSKEAIDLMNTLSNYIVEVYIDFLAEEYLLGKLYNDDINNKLDLFKEKFVKYAFDDKKRKRTYLKSSDYFDITSKLSNEHFQKQLRKKC